jgi:glycosyltransferase involved in cell wall biosynthesis
MALRRQMMRIALVYAHFNLTGSLPRRQVALAHYLVSAGHEVHAYSLEADSLPDLAPEVSFHWVPATRPAGSRLGLPLHVASFAWGASRALARERHLYDVVHGLGMSTWTQDIVHVTGVVNGEIKRDLRARRQGGIRDRAKGVLIPAISPIVPTRKVIERLVFLRHPPAQIHTAGRWVRDDLLDAYELDPRRIRVIPPGVDVTEFRPAADKRAARERIGISNDRPVLLFCGHSWERKGLDRAIRALAGMQNPAQLLVVGEGDPAQYLAQAQHAGVAAYVSFVGPRTDTWRYYQAADVFVLPTRVDLWGMTVVEAMASGIPAVTTTGAGAADVVTHEHDGFVLPEPLDPALLATTLDRLVGDAGLRTRIGRAAEQRARGLTWQEHGRRVEAAMCEFVETRPRRSPDAEAA